jgi:hypothetical protein
MWIFGDSREGVVSDAPIGPVQRWGLRRQPSLGGDLAAGLGRFTSPRDGVRGMVRQRLRTARRQHGRPPCQRASRRTPGRRRPSSGCGLLAIQEGVCSPDERGHLFPRGGTVALHTRSTDGVAQPHPLSRRKARWPATRMTALETYRRS